MSCDDIEDRYTGLAWAVVARIPTVLTEVRERLAEGQPDYAAFLDEAYEDIVAAAPAFVLRLVEAAHTGDQTPEALRLTARSLRIARAYGIRDDPLFVDDHLDAILVHQDDELLATLRSRCRSPLEGLALGWGPTDDAEDARPRSDETPGACRRRRSAVAPSRDGSGCRLMR